MAGKRLYEILTEPVSAITKAKREKDISKTLQILIIEWIFIALAIALIPTVPLAFKTTAIVLVALIGIVSTLFMGFLTQLVFNILGGEGKYFEGLTSAVYAKFPISVGLIASSIVFLMPVVGAPIAVVISIIFTVLGIVIFYRAVKELFSTDIITTWIGVGILVTGLILGFYLALIPFVGTLGPQLGDFGGLGFGKIVGS